MMERWKTRECIFYVCMWMHRCVHVLACFNECIAEKIAAKDNKIAKKNFFFHDRLLYTRVQSLVYLYLKLPVRSWGGVGK